MSKQEILCTPIGEMLDMMSCMAIFEGGAKEKEPPMTMEEIFDLT